MPITITPAAPGNLIGPGIPLAVSSDFVGPMPSNSYWSLTLSQDDNANNLILRHQEPFVVNQQTLWPLINNQVQNPRETDWMVKPNDPVYVQVQLHEPTAQVDTGSGVGVWDPTTGLWAVIQAQGQQLLQGAFTTTDRGQLQTTTQNTTQQQQDWAQYTSVTLPSLQDTLNNIFGGISSTVTTAAGAVAKTIGELFSGKTLDLLTEETLATACAPDRIDHQLVPAIWYGIQVNITQYPDYTAWTAPGESWTPADLAVLQIFRGGDLVLRQGIHSRRHEVYPLPGVPLIPMELSVPITPPDYRIVVDLAYGVCVELVGLYLP